MHGALPLSPTNASLRYSDRQTQAIPRNSAGAPGNQGRFFSRNPPAASSRVPFQQQQRAMQQSFGGQGRSFGAQGTATTNPAGNRSWNGFGNPSGGVAAGQPGGSRFGSSSYRTGGAPQSAASSPWSRFGNPVNNSASPAPSQNYNRYSNTPQAVPRGQSPQRNYAVPYSAPSSPRSAPYSSQPSRGSQNYYSQPSRSLQISQPIVGQRSAPPQYSRPSYSTSAPSYSRGGGGSSPAPRTSYSTGGHSSGGGGGHRR